MVGKRHRNQLLSVSTEHRIRSDGLKLQQRRFRIDIWKKFLIMRVAKFWNRFSRNVVKSVSPEAKCRLDKCCSGVV